MCLMHESEIDRFLSRKTSKINVENAINYSLDSMFLKQQDEYFDKRL